MRNIRWHSRNSSAVPAAATAAAAALGLGRVVATAARCGAAGVTAAGRVAAVDDAAPLPGAVGAHDGPNDRIRAAAVIETRALGTGRDVISPPEVGRGTYETTEM
jgi:hypothetical protein